MPPIVVPSIVPPPLAALTTKALPPARPVSVVLAPLPVIWPEPAVYWMPTVPAKADPLNVPVPVVTLAVGDSRERGVAGGRTREQRRSESDVLGAVVEHERRVGRHAGREGAAGGNRRGADVERARAAVWAKVRPTAPPAQGCRGPPEPWPVVWLPPFDVRFPTVRLPLLLEIAIEPPIPPSPPVELPVLLAAPASPPEAVIAPVVEVPPEKFSSVTAPPAPPLAPSPPLLLLSEPLPPRAEITPVFSVCPDPLTVRWTTPPRYRRPRRRRSRCLPRRWRLGCRC